MTISLTPFGRTGPYRHYKGSDAIANASGGFLYGQGDDTKGQCTAPSHLAYQVAACVAATLGLAGIRHARVTGAGQRIDVSLQEALTFTNSSSVARYTRENRLERRPGGKDYGGAGTNIYRCKDGRYVHFTTNMPHMWREFAQNWMTDKILAGPEWENQNTVTRTLRKCRRPSPISSASLPPKNLPRRRNGVILPPPRSTQSDSSSNVNSFGRANGFKRSSILSSAATPRPDFPCAFIDADAGAPAGALLDQHRNEILDELEHATHNHRLQPCSMIARANPCSKVFVWPISRSSMPVHWERPSWRITAWRLSRSSPLLFLAKIARRLPADMNRAKLGCTINLRHPEGKELFKRLVAASDVVVDNFSSGVWSGSVLVLKRCSRSTPASCKS